MAAPRPGPITVNTGRPQRGLIPTDTIEGYGGRIVDLLFTGLYEYDADGRPCPALADTLSTPDNQHFTITLQPGRTFTDGTPVTAHDFVDTWNFGALSTNGQLLRSFYAPIDGYDDVAAEIPRATTLSGLRAVDDLTLTIRLCRPSADFATRLGFLPFKPLPRAFFTSDRSAFGALPTGNGPYRLAGPITPGSRRIDLLPNPGYRGPHSARNEGISFLLYDDLDEAYAALLDGRLDVLDAVPDSRLGTYRRDLGDRAVEKPIALNKSLAIPHDLPHFSGEEGRLRRAALSHAINRERITHQLFHNTRSPARDFTARSLPGFNPDLPGADVLLHRPRQAAELWAKADELAPWSGTLTLAYNHDGGHQEWIDAVARDITDALGIDARGLALPTFKEVRDRVLDGTLGSCFRKGWRGDYPSMISFLEPLFAQDAGANDTGYHNAEFEQWLTAANTAATRQAEKFLARAQTVLLHDLPVIPLWDYLAVGGHGASITAPFRWNGLPDYTQLVRTPPGDPSC
ncbi:oligopeptide transport system substrate-binding protein [Streptomyces sp. TLI_55]|uniref:peptide ABC transporter substrate-binding protein n=1 Tax=Streptomyces sp. TLI_55 TaxID=1938861 RepID=UPI000BD5C3AB|nr:ABC transporter substrate-binding protein [Streptomyces sp. TLI_55]SNX88539.1 oligopeptide transport system substrate-binding protein [Streptomyces sp. TLI_55]